MNPSEPTANATASPSPAKKCWTLWLIFTAVLLSPVIASCLAGALDKQNGDAAPVVALLGGGVGGIVCGAMIGWRMRKSTALRIVWGIVFAAVMVVVCVGMSCFGCLASGYQMSFR